MEESHLDNTFLNKKRNREGSFIGEFASNMTRNNEDLQSKYKVLTYEIDSFSSYIKNFHPSNILTDSANNPSLSKSSKWSVDFKRQNEYVTLKLEKQSILKYITFQKNQDPTNMKEFKLYLGKDPKDMKLVLHSGLSSDPVYQYETFSINTKYDFPCK